MEVLSLQQTHRPKTGVRGRSIDVYGSEGDFFRDGFMQLLIFSLHVDCIDRSIVCSSGESARRTRACCRINFSPKTEAKPHRFGVKTFCFPHHASPSTLESRENLCGKRQRHCYGSSVPAPELFTNASSTNFHLRGALLTFKGSFSCWERISPHLAKSQSMLLFRV